MADNTEEEHLDNPTINQSENASDNLPPTTDIETITPNQKIENMEVHHHAHHEGKKNLKSYFWEFLMLFLAVFCGFLAEYQLEHIIEHQREKKYAALIYNDLKTDTASYNILDKSILKSITKYQNEKAVLKNSKTLADSSFARISTDLWSAFGFNSTSTTFNQMKTSGSLRYIGSDSLIAKLSTYYDKTIPAISKSFEYINEKLHSQIEPIFAEHFNIFDNSLDKLTWTPATIYLNRSESSDMIIKNRLYLYYFGVRYIYNVPLPKIKTQAVQLLNLLKAEYHLN